MSRKENALDLAKFVDKAVRVKRIGNTSNHACGRASTGSYGCIICMCSTLISGKACIKASKCCHAVEGVLKGYDPLLNLVLDETKEYLRGAVHA